MTPALSDPQIERYSRQILLPEVGGRGQARLLAGRIAVAGDTEPARIAALLTARAGVGHLDLVAARGWRPSDTGPDCRVREIAVAEVAQVDVVVDLAGDASLTATLAHARPYILGRMNDTSATLATLIGRPCAACFSPGANAATTDDSLAAPLALALGALAASEALSALLARPATGRLHTLGVGDGTFTSRALAPAGRCSACGAGA